MKPACTAECTDRAMLELLIDELAGATDSETKECPFVVDGPLHDGLNVDITDPECAINAHENKTLTSTPREEFTDMCRRCIRDALEARVIERGRTA